MSKRRAHGEGTIYQRADGLWVAQITLPNGKRKAKYSKTQKVVKDWLLEQREAIKKGLWLDNTKITVSEFFDRFMNDVASHTLRPKTIVSYESIIRLHINPEIGNVKLAALTPVQLQTLYSKKLNSGLSKRTVQYIHAVIHRGLAQAVKWGLVNRNVADAVEAPRPTKRAPTTLTVTQVRDLLGVMREDRFYALYLLAITTGMRQGELLGLMWDDVDLDQGFIHVRHTAQTIYKQGVVLGETKTEKSRRSIAIPEIAIDALKEHWETQKLIKAGRRDWVENNLVFPTSKGTPMTARNLIREFHALLEKAGLPKIRFHDLRHTSATLLLLAGVHPKIVQERLGHSRIDMTLDTYSHVVPDIQKEAAEKMDLLLSSK